MEEKYEFKLLEQREQLKDYHKSFEKNGVSKDISKLEWIHFNNTVSSPLTLLNYNEGNICSIYATMPVYFKIDNNNVKCCQSLDTLTDKDHRGKGLFIKSARSLYNKAKEDKYQLVYGFPNAFSVGGFVKKLDWNLLDPVPFLFKPIRTGYFLKKFFGKRIGKILDFGISRVKKNNLKEGEEIKQLQQFDKNVDLVWESFSKKIKVSINRDYKYLNWRYFEKPNENYKVFGFYKNEALKAIVVYVVKKKHGGKIGYIMESMAFEDNERLGKLLIRYAVNQMINSKVDIVLSWCFNFSPNYLYYKKNNFFNLPKKLRPIELHFGYGNLGINEEILRNRNNWYISYSDSDTV